MQDNINEIYRMRQEAYDRKRKEFEDEIKQCDLNMFACSKDKSEPDEEFRTIYLQRCELLRKYREKYGKKAEYQLRDQLDENRKAYVEQYVSDYIQERIEYFEAQDRWPWLLGELCYNKHVLCFGWSATP